MSETKRRMQNPTGPSGAPRTAARALLVLAFVTLTAVAVGHYLRDSKLREQATRFIESFDIDERRPAQASTIELAPAFDLAYEMAGDIALQDSLNTVRVTEMDTATRQLWLLNMSRVDEELAAAEGLLLDAVAERPGWAYHRSVLGMVDYAQRIGEGDARWLSTLRHAMRVSPGDASIPMFAGSALTESWDSLDDSTREATEPIFRLALHDPEFVSGEYVRIVELVGPQPAYALLPDTAPALDAAMKAHSEDNDVISAARLYVRWERAEWQERERDLAAIRERDRYNDISGARTKCVLWRLDHPVELFDTPAGRAQAAEVLSLWPREPGKWGSDGRTELVRYFMNRRLGDIDPDVLAQTAAVLGGLPPSLAARIALASGDVYGAERLASSAQAVGSLEWTEFFVELAKHYLSEGERSEAEAVLAKIAGSASDECDVALVRRAAAASRGVRLPLNPNLFLKEYPPMFWAAAGVPICIDPSAGFQAVVIDLEVMESPALANFGFNGGRSMTRLLPEGRSRVRVPVRSREGRHFLNFQTLAGGSIAPSSARLE